MERSHRESEERFSIGRSMKKRTLCLICIGMTLCGACSWIQDKLNVEHDGFAEEILEEVIKDQLDINLDLTPSSKEYENVCPSCGN